LLCETLERLAERLGKQADTDRGAGITHALTNATTQTSARGPGPRRSDRAQTG
jgi:hypothetical protein